MTGERAFRYRAETFGTAVVMPAPVTSWWTAYSVISAHGAGRAVLTAAVTIKVLAIGTAAFRARAVR